MLGLFEIDRSYREVYEDSRVSTSDNIERWFEVAQETHYHYSSGVLLDAFVSLNRWIQVSKQSLLKRPIQNNQQPSPFKINI